jgi:Flp pilus assembly protein TadD
MRLYFQSEAADKAGKGDEAVELVGRLSQLVEANPTTFSAEQCPWVGNAAVTAERWDQDELATRLYQQAVQLDPEHANNLQNFVDFIVNRQVSDLYDEAQRYLEKLKTGKLATHRPDRTAALEARLAARRGTGGGGEEGVQQQVEAFLRDPQPDFRSYVSLMSVLPEIGWYDAAQQVCRHYDATSGDRYLVVRVLADALASSGDDNYRLQALEMYRFLLNDEGYLQGQGKSNVPDVEHNYATLLYAADYNEEAGRIWYRAYQQKAGDTQVRRPYAMYLMGAGRPDLAELAFEGKPLGVTEPVLQTEGNQVPEHFTDPSVERWWEAPPA